eukprot:5480586-Prymnesium_polylepis.1
MWRPDCPAATSCSRISKSVRLSHVLSPRRAGWAASGGSGMAKGARREGRRSCAEGGDEVRFVDLITPRLNV